jgi:acyl carrier protein
MTSGLGESSQERWRRAGVASIPPNQGLEVIEQLLGRSSTQATVLPVDWSKFFARLEEGGEAPFLSVVARLNGTAGSRPSSSKVPGTVARLLAAAPGDRQALLIEHLRGQVASVLELPPSHRLDPEGNLDELGLDSLMAIELRNALQETLGCSLPATLLYENQTLVTLAQYLLAHSFDQKEGRDREGEAQHHHREYRNLPPQEGGFHQGTSRGV